MRRFDTLKTIIAGAIASFVFVQSAAAVVFKWKDDKGNYYFTDDLSKVPLQFRTLATIETVRGTGKLSSDTVVSPAPAASPTEDKSKIASVKKKVAPGVDKRLEEMKKMVEEKPLIQESITYLENEIKRDEEMSAYLPTTINGKYIVESVQRFLSAKKGLAEKTAKSETPSLKGTFSFLSTSLEKDAQEKISVDQGMQTRTYQLIDRLKAELSTMKQLVTQLNGDLAKISQAFAAPTPFYPPPEFPKMEVIETPEAPETVETADAAKADTGKQPLEEISSNSVKETEESSPPADKGGTESFGKISDILKKGGIKFPKLD